MKLGPDEFFVSWLPKTVCDNTNSEIKSNYAPEIRFSPQKEKSCNEALN